MIIIIHYKQLSVLMINLASMSFSLSDHLLCCPFSFFSWKRKATKIILANCCKLFVMQNSVFQTSLRSEKGTNLHTTIIIIVLHKCPGYTHLSTLITITGVLNCCQLYDNYQQNNRMEGKKCHGNQRLVIKWKRSFVNCSNT